MEDLIIKAKRGSIIEIGIFDKDKEMEIEFEDSAGVFNYDWISADQAKQLARHLIGALEEIGETI